MNGRRSWISLAGCGALLFGAAMWACSSSSNGTTAGGDDGGTGGDDGSGGDSGSSLATCGPPPYINLGVIVQAASTDKNPARVPGAVLTSPLCPDASFTADDNGAIQGLVTENVPFYGRFNANAFAATLSPEQEFDADVPELAISLPPSLLTAIVPGYDASKPTIFVEVLQDGGHDHDGGASCNDPSGIALSVQGHPEAVVTYYSADSIPAPVNGATATTAGGKASIVGVDASASPVTLVGTKTGCTVSFVKDTSTGRIPLENGYISIAGAYLRD